MGVELTTTRLEDAAKWAKQSLVEKGSNWVREQRELATPIGDARELALLGPLRGIFEAGGGELYSHPIAFFLQTYARATTRIATNSSISAKPNTLIIGPFGPIVCERLL